MVVADKGRRRLAHIPALDGLRGVAVVGVLLYHGGHLQGGYLGVDLFFVLSGFLITTLLLLEWGNDRRIALGHFWSRRARRLLPALVGLLFVAALWARFVALPVDLGTIRGDGLAALLYVANWHSIAIGQNYFQASQAPSPLEHVWSLAIEEQFYLVWPLLVIGLLKLRNRPSTIFVASVVLTIVSAGAMILLHGFTSASTNSLYLGTHTRAAAVAMGAALAAWNISHRRAPTKTERLRLEVIGLVGVAGLAWAWLALPITSPVLYSGGLALCGLAATAVIASIAAPDSPLIGRALTLRPLCWLGMISYGLYLWHWPIFLYLSEQRTGMSGWPLFFVQVLAAVSVAIVSYQLLEMPIRRGAFSADTWRFVTPAVATLVVLALVFSTTGAVDVGNRGNDVAARGDLSGDGPPGSPTVMVFGDSVAGELIRDGMTPCLDDLGVTVRSSVWYGCNPMRAVGTMVDHRGTDREGQSTDCTKDWRAAATSTKPDAAVIVLGGAPIYTVDIDGTPRTPCDPEYRAALQDKLEQVYADVGSSGAKVYVVTNVGNDDGRFLATMPADLDERIACTNDTYRAAASNVPGTEVLDLEAFICPEGDGCTQSTDGDPVRADGIHFQGAGARYVADWLIPQVTGAKPSG